jgi:hypothetical protein
MNSCSVDLIRETAVDKNAKYSALSSSVIGLNVMGSLTPGYSAACDMTLGMISGSHVTKTVLVALSVRALGLPQVCLDREAQYEKFRTYTCHRRDHLLTSDRHSVSFPSWERLCSQRDVRIQEYLPL